MAHRVRLTVVVAAVLAAAQLPNHRIVAQDQPDHSDQTASQAQVGVDAGAKRTNSAALMHITTRPGRKTVPK